MKKISSFFFIFIAIFVSLQAQNFSQIEVPDPKDVAKIPDNVQLGNFHRGENIKLLLNIVLKEGWYIYSLFQNKEVSLPTKLQFSKSTLDLKERAFETQALQKTDSLGQILLIQENQPRFYQNFFVPLDHKLGKAEFSLNFFYQLCSEQLCFPPQNKIIPISYNIKDKKVRAKYAFINRQVDKNIFLPQNSNQKKSFLGFLLLAITSGFLAWASPCAFAVLPLIVLFFSNKKQNFLSLKQYIFFLAGICITFSLIGIAMTLFLGVSQLLNFLTNGWSYLLAAIFFLLFSLSFFGIFTSFKMPIFFAKLQNNFFAESSKKNISILKVFLGGSIFTITIFSCTFPFIGSLLVASSFSNLLYPTLGMLFFSFAFVSPLFIFYFFPKLLFFWKNGAFILEFKFLLGIFALLAALKFFSFADIFFSWGILSRKLAIIIVIATFFFGVFRVLKIIFPPKKKDFFSLSVVVFYTIVIFALIRGYSNKSLGFVDAILPFNEGVYLEKNNKVSKEELDSLKWLTKINIAKKKATESTKPIFLDFSGKTCTNCRWMEQNIFSEKQIFKQLQENFILLRLYTDVGESAKENLQYQIKKFNNIALPFYAIISVDGKILAQNAGIMNNADFLKFLQKNI